MPVVWKWLGWFLCFWGVVYIVRAVVNPINRLPARTTRIGSVLDAGPLPAHNGEKKRRLLEAANCVHSVLFGEPAIRLLFP